MELKKVDSKREPEAANVKHDLSDKQLEEVAGGWGRRTCPDCGSSNLSYDSFLMMFVCNNCGSEF